MQKPTDEDLDFIVGAISNFFGFRMGTYRASRILKTYGIRYEGKNKAEQLASGLKTIATDPTKMAQVLTALIQHHTLGDDEITTLGQMISRLDLRIEKRTVVRGSPIEKVYKGGSPFDAFKDIEALMQSATSRVLIVDTYVDESLFPLYFANLPKSINLHILTKKMCSRFDPVARVYKSQHPNFQVRLSTAIHDRNLIIDDRAWILGQAIKDAGNKPLTIVELTDPKSVKAIFDIFDSLWGSAIPVL